MILKQAWRNIWRNRRRTMITIASIAFAVFFSVIQRGFHLGSWDSLISSIMHSYSGYLQVHAKDYWKEHTFDYSFVDNDSLQKNILENNDIVGIIPRIESFALISIADKTKGILVLGIDTEKENRFTQLQSKLVSGKMLNNNDSSVMISQRLSKFLNTKIGDTIVLLSQGYHGASAAGVFPIKGIVRLPAPEWDNQMVYIPLATAQKFYSMEGRLTSYVVDLKNSRKMDDVAENLSSVLSKNDFEVMTWKEMLKELYQQYVLDMAGGFILLAILYMIVGFGIFGTVLMMTNERIHEFAIMTAIGMKSNILSTILIIEMLFIAFIGVIIGMFISVPILTYFHIFPIEFTGEYAKTMEVYGMEPIMPVLWKAYYILNQGVIVFVLTFFAILYPIYYVRKLNLIKSLKK